MVGALRNTMVLVAAMNITYSWDSDDTVSLNINATVNGQTHSKAQALKVKAIDEDSATLAAVRPDGQEDAKTLTRVK